MEADFLPNSMAYEVVRYGLKGVRNLLDPDGNEVAFESATRHLGGTDIKCAAERILRCLPLDVIRELSEEIQRKKTSWKTTKQKTPTGSSGRAAAAREAMPELPRP